jgi:hypothetical protein
VGGTAVKTVGTNCAFRREALLRLGGFDDRFRYFLDETDVNLRLAGLGLLTAVVPEAEVIHGMSESDTRRADRAPRDLTQIGASAAVFLGKHCPPGDRAAALAAFRAEQRRRALRHLVPGTLEPRDIRRLLASFDRGAAEGAARPAPPPPAFGPTPGFLPLRTDGGPSRHILLARRSWTAAEGRRAAAVALASGDAVVTLLLLSPDARTHRLRFVEPGVWEQRGGILGRSDRTTPRPGWALFRRRVQAETRRIAPIRLPLKAVRHSVAAPQQK